MWCIANPKLLPFCRSRCRRRRCCFKSSLIRQVFLTVHAKLRKLRANYKRPNITSLLSEKKVLANDERCTPRSTCKQWRHRSAAILVHVCLVAAYFLSRPYKNNSDWLLAPVSKRWPIEKSVRKKLELILLRRSPFSKCRLLMASCLSEVGNPYKVLGVAANCTHEEVKRAYQKLVLKVR